MANEIKTNLKVPIFKCVDFRQNFRANGSLGLAIKTGFRKQSFLVPVPTST
jgi:hypothetical protein